MTSKFVFIGSRAEILGTPLVFTAFGQTVNLEQAEADALILDQNIPLLPENLFAAAKEDPLACRMALHEYRISLAKPVVPTLAAEINETVAASPAETKEL